MKKISLFLLLSLLSLSIFAQISTEKVEEGFKILEEVDNQMAYKGDYSCTASIIIQKPGKPNENLQYKMYERIGKEIFTMVQIFPDADKGKGYLKDGDNMWAYDPIGRKFSHSSLKDALGDSDINVDDMSNDDKRYRNNYNITDSHDEKLGNYDVTVLTLEAKTSKPAYDKTILYIRKDVKLILKQCDYSSSGRLMRTILIPKYAKTEKGYVGYHNIIRDELNPGEQTQQIISDLSFDTLPDKIFTKAYLEGLN